MQDKLPDQFGFCNEPFTVHTSRTMMLNELHELLTHVPSSSSEEEYVRFILDDNILGKPTISSRNKTAKFIVQLYSFNIKLPVYKALLFFYKKEPHTLPILASLCSHARDTLLHFISDEVLSLPFDSPLSLERVKQKLEEGYPGRFSSRTLHSTAQNIASSYQQSGHLKGRRIKYRSKPIVTPAVVSYALFLGYLCDIRGEYLLKTQWTKLLDLSSSSIMDMAKEAHKLGWITVKSIGSIVEMSFEQLLPNKERISLHE